MIVFPLTAVILLYLIGKSFFKSNYLFLFLLGTTAFSIIDFVGLRHLIPELALVLYFVATINQSKKHFLYSGILMGIAFTSSLEYAVIGIICLVLYTYLKNGFSLKVDIEKYKTFLLPLTTIGGAFLLYLVLNGALSNFINYYISSSSAFYAHSPCRDYFPRLFQLTSNEIGFYQYFSKLKYYLIPLFLIVNSLIIFKKRESIKYWPEIIATSLFALLSYTRPLMNTCDVYLNYGMVFVLFSLVLTLQEKGINKYKKIPYWLFISYLIVIQVKPLVQKINLTAFNTQRNNIYYERLSYKISPELKEQFEEVITYIKDNSQDNDLVITYPHGPYAQMLNRKPVKGTTSTLYYQLVPEIIPEVLDNLKASPPTFVVLNGINARDYLSAIYKLPYNVVSSNNRVHFTGWNTEVEKYISSNYQIEKKFENVWILKKTKDTYEKEIYLAKSFDNISVELINLEQVGASVFKPTSKNPSLKIAINKNQLQDAAIIRIPLWIEMGMLKPFSKFAIQTFISADDVSYTKNGSFILSGDEQNSNVSLVEGIKKVLEIPEVSTLYIKVVVSENVGFSKIPVAPKLVGIGNIHSLMFNKDITVDDVLIDIEGFKGFIKPLLDRNPTY